MCREHVQRLLAPLLTRRNHPPEDLFRAGLVPLGTEDELQVAVVRPPGERLAQLQDVGFVVVVIGPKRVQLHHLAGVVLVPGVGLAQVVVEVLQHGRVGGRGVEHVLELAEHVAADDGVLVISGGPRPGRRVPPGQVDEEVVAPEVAHHFLELPVAHDRPEQHLIGQSFVKFRVVVLIFADSVLLSDLLQRHLGPREPLRQRVLQGRVLDLLRLQLPLDPLLPAALRQHLVHLARSGAEAQAVQDVDHFLALGQRRALERLHLRGLRGLSPGAALKLQHLELLQVRFADLARLGLTRRGGGLRLGERKARQGERRGKRPGR